MNVQSVRRAKSKDGTLVIVGATDGDKMYIKHITTRKVFVEFSLSRAEKLEIKSVNRSPISESKEYLEV